MSKIQGETALSRVLEKRFGIGRRKGTAAALRSARKSELASRRGDGRRTKSSTEAKIGVVKRLRKESNSSLDRAGGAERGKDGNGGVRLGGINIEVSVPGSEDCNIKFRA